MTGNNRGQITRKKAPGAVRHKARTGISRRRKTQSKKSGTQALVFVKPQSSDVLMGKGPGFVNHPGNLRFQELTDAKYAAYNDARCKRARAFVREGVVEAIRRAGGRFLSMDEDTGRWFEVSKKVAEEKVAMSIRNTRRKAPSASASSSTSNNGELRATNVAATPAMVPLTPLPVAVWLSGVPLLTTPQMQYSGAVVNGATLLYPSWPIVSMMGPSLGASQSAVPSGGTPAQAIVENTEHQASSTNVNQAKHEGKEPITEQIAIEEV